MYKLSVTPKLKIDRPKINQRKYSSYSTIVGRSTIEERIESGFTNDHVTLT